MGKRTISRFPAWFGPAVLAACFLLVLAGLLADVRARRLETERTLFADAVKEARESIAARLQGDREFLKLIADEISAGRLDEDSFQVRASHFVADHPELVNLTWADQDFIIRWTAPYEPNKQVVGLELSLPEPARASRLAAKTGQPAYTRPFEIIQGHTAIEVYVPAFRDGAFIGTLGGVYTLERLLRHVVPPSVQANYHLAFVRDSGESLYALPATDAIDPRLRRTVPLDIPGAGVALVLARYGPEEGLWARQDLAPIALIIALAAGMAWGMWMLERTRRELELRVQARTEQLAASNDQLRREIDDSTVAKELAKSAEGFLKQIIDGIPEELMVIDHDYRVIQMNRCLREQSADPDKAPTCLMCYEASHRRDTPCRGEDHPCPLEEVIETKSPVRTTHTHYDANGTPRIIELFAAPILDQNGEVTHVIESGRDITERMKIQEDLTQSEERLRLTLEATRDGLWDWNVQTGEALFSPRYYTMLGYEPGEFPGTYEAWRNLLHPDDVETSEEAIRQHFQGDSESYAIEFRLRTKNGSWKWILGRGRIVERDEAGAPLRMVGTHEDISSLKEAEEAVRRSERRFRSLIENASDIIMILDSEGFITYVSPSIQRILGYEPRELEGESVFPLVHGDNVRAVQRAHERAVSLLGIPNWIEVPFRAKDGAWHTLEAVSRAVQGEGKSISVIVNARDVSERKRAEARAELHQRQLVQASKMATLGTLVAGVAHEINNPNFLVMANASVLRTAWQDVLPVLDKCAAHQGDFMLAGAPYSVMREEVADLFDAVREGADRIKRIVQELRDYARERPPDLTHTVDVNAVVKSALALLANTTRKASRHFHVAYAEHLPAIKGDPQRLEQVVINLMQNACQALPDPDKEIAVQTSCHPEGHSVVIQVRDHGVGIPQPDLPRVTDPFFTTRRDAGGTGLGLSITASIVAAHNGTLEFDSSVGKGTTVRVTLPAPPGASQEG